MKNNKNSSADRSSMNVTLALKNADGTIDRYRAGTIKRYLSKLRKSGAVEFNVLVRYGREKDCFGKTIEFTNQYFGENKDEATEALNAFVET